jgi:hypothetical protein
MKYEYGAMVDSKGIILNEKPAQCNFVYHKSHMDWTGIVPYPPRCVPGDQLPGKVDEEEERIGYCITLCLIL